MPLLVIMIDGVSADYFATSRGRLPHLSALANRGLVVENLHSEVLGTSLPGRTSMMTGFTADKTGIYGNKIWGGNDFRYANPDDIRVPTLPARAKAAGLDVAVIGFGMIRPEDTDLFVPPWWISAFIQRARDPEPEAADDAWLRVYSYVNRSHRLQAMCERAEFPGTWPELNGADKFTYGTTADHYVLNWAGIAAADSEDAPDLIVTEYLMTDSVQHATGYQTEMSHLSVAQADMAVGGVIERLRSAGVLDQWNIAVMSDHGHSEIKESIHPQVIIPDTIMQSEGSVMMVRVEDADHLERIAAALAPYGVKRFHTNYIPADHRDQIAAFIAPDHVTFELDDPDETEPVGPPRNKSSHGLRPGLPGDDRFCILAGSDVPQGNIPSAKAVQVAPTLAKILGLPLDDFPAQPIF